MTHVFVCPDSIIDNYIIYIPFYSGKIFVTVFYVMFFVVLAVNEYDCIPVNFEAHRLLTLQTWKS